MKYKIQNVITMETNDGTINDIIYQELSEQEFLVKYLKDPNMIYWKIYEDGSRDYYSKGSHMAHVDTNGNATNIAGIKSLSDN